MKNSNRLGRFLSYVLRHQPSAAGLTLDRSGYAEMKDLLAGVRAAGHDVTREDILRCVAEDAKGRFEMCERALRIRAAQGHSIEVDLGLAARQPPDILWHGTVPAAIEGIRDTGIERRKRHHVHLSPDQESATVVGRRRGRPVLLPVHAGAMYQAGHVFYLSANGVWLTDHVPAEYVDFRALVYPEKT